MNILTIAEVEKAFGTKFSAKDKKALESSKPKYVPETHIALPALPLTIADILKEHPKLVFSLWFKDHEFAKEKLSTEWLVMRKDLIENSTNKTFPEQEKLLPAGERLPSAVEAIYLIVAWKLVNNEWLYPRTWISTSSFSGDGLRVMLGCGDGYGGLEVYDWGGNSSSDVGLGASRITSSRSLNHENLDVSEPSTLEISVNIKGVEYKGTITRA